MYCVTFLSLERASIGVSPCFHHAKLGLLAPGPSTVLTHEEKANKCISQIVELFL